MGRREYDGRQCANAVEKEEVAMWRTFGVQTLSGVAQPLLGDKLTAAMAIPPASVDPIITVANTALYQDGDRITIDPGNTDSDEVMVVNIISPTTMQVTSQGAPYHAHAVNTVIALDLVCGLVLINPVAVAASLWIGADKTVTNVGGGSAFLPLIGGSSYNLGQGQWNVLRSTDQWMAGTGGDTVGIGVYVV
jgi:hypothetical protein